MANKKTCGIYKITNTITNETYIGQSKDIEKRVATHKEDLKNGNHINKSLQEDYDLAKSLNPDYEIFSFKIIKKAKVKDLNKSEMYYINEFNSFERGYNRTIGGIHDETKGHVDYGGGRLFTDEKRIKLITKELTNDVGNKENYIFKTTSNRVICSKCGKEFSDEFDFCPYCGNEKPKPKICPKCKLEPSIEFNFCPKCGIELIDKEEYLKELEKKKKEEEERKRLKEELEKKKKEEEERKRLKEELEKKRRKEKEESLRKEKEQRQKLMKYFIDVYNFKFNYEINISIKKQIENGELTTKDEIDKGINKLIKIHRLLKYAENKKYNHDEIKVEIESLIRNKILTTEKQIDEKIEELNEDKLVNIACCPYCGSNNIITDFEREEMICGKCGIVLSEEQFGIGN